MKEYIKNNWKTIVPTLIAAIAVVFLLRDCHDRDILLQNMAALADSTRVVMNKAGELEAERLVLMADKNTLKALNHTLYDELEKERGKTHLIQKTDLKIIRDTIRVPHNIMQTNDSTYVVSWGVDEVDTGWTRQLAGESTVFLRDNALYGGSTLITKDIIGMTLFTGLTEREDGKWVIWARTPNPDVSFDIEGAVIDPSAFGYGKKDPVVWKFGIGPYVEVDRDLFDQSMEYKAGLNATLWYGKLMGSLYGQFSIIGGTNFSPKAGVRVQYNLLDF